VVVVDTAVVVGDTPVVGTRAVADAVVNSAVEGAVVHTGVVGRAAVVEQLDCRGRRRGDPAFRWLYLKRRCILEPPRALAGGFGEHRTWAQGCLSLTSLKLIFF